MSMVLKYPGLTIRQSIGTAVSCGRIDLSVVIIGWVLKAPAPKGIPDDTTAPRAPGIVCKDSNRERYSSGALVLRGYWEGGGESWKVIKLCGSKPSRTLCRLVRLRMNNPAPISNTVASAISTTANPFRSCADIRPEEPRPPCLIMAFRSTFAVRKAGTIPKSSPVTMVNPNAYQKTVASISTSGIGSVLGGNDPLMMCTAQNARANPPMPPTSEYITLSTSS